MALPYDLGDFEFGISLPMPDCLVITLATATLEDANLGVALLRDDLGGHCGTRDDRTTDLRLAGAADEQHVRQDDFGANLTSELLDLESLTLLHPVLLAP